MQIQDLFNNLLDSEQPTPEPRCAFIPRTTARCVGNGAGAPSFELRRLAQELGVPSWTRHEGGGTSGVYVTEARFATEREARMAERAARWFVTGLGGAVFGC